MDDAATLAPTEPIPPDQPAGLHKIFVGKDGLRAGWSLVLFVTLFLAIFFSLNFLGHKIHPPHPRTGRTPGDMTVPPSFAIGEGVFLIVTLLVTWIMSKIEGRPNSVYGLGGTRKARNFFAGLGWGVTCLSLLILTLLKTGFLAIDSRLLFGSDILRYGAFWLFSFLMVGVFEEYLTRGFLQYTLSRGLTGIYQWVFKTPHSAALGFWTSAIAVSVLFGLGHGDNPGESPIGLLSAGVVSLVFCFSLWRTGSLWWAIGFHASWDWAQSFLYGVADSGAMVQNHLLATHPIGKPILSGGSTGPEGSIFILAILALVSLIILFTLPRVRYGDAPARPA